jgi:hypothetical protein
LQKICQDLLLARVKIDGLLFNQNCVRQWTSKLARRGGMMLNTLNDRTRSSAAVALIAATLAITLAAPRALAKDGDRDRDDGGGRKCRGWSTEASFDRSAFPQPEVRRSYRGVLRTTLHACISDYEMSDQNVFPPETVKIHPRHSKGQFRGRL